MCIFPSEVLARLVAKISDVAPAHSHARFPRDATNVVKYCAFVREEREHLHERIASRLTASLELADADVYYPTLLALNSVKNN